MLDFVEIFQAEILPFIDSKNFGIDFYEENNEFKLNLTGITFKKEALMKFKKEDNIVKYCINNTLDRMYSSSILSKEQEEF